MKILKEVFRNKYFKTNILKLLFQNKKLEIKYDQKCFHNFVRYMTPYLCSYMVCS